jgi:hypothetical protein
LSGPCPSAEYAAPLLCDIDELRFRPEPGESGLMLGYGNLNDAVVDEAVAVLAEVIRRTHLA